MTSRHRHRPSSASVPRPATEILTLAAGVLLLAVSSLGADTAAPNPTAPGGKVNINAASVSQIAMLPRIGEKVATRVLD